MIDEVLELLGFANEEDSFIDDAPESLASEAVESMDELLGQTLGRYRITRLIGEGGMGVVYEATDTRLARRVALKVLGGDFTSDSEKVKRFIHEARAASSLNHPNILTVYDFGEYKSPDSDERFHYIAMEYVDGQTLKELMSDKTISVNEVIGYLIQACAGLEKAHQAGIVHRDLKPENLMISSDGFVKLLETQIVNQSSPFIALPSSLLLCLPSFFLLSLRDFTPSQTVIVPFQIPAQNIQKPSTLWKKAERMFA